MKKVSDIFKELGFKEEAPFSLKKAVIQSIINSSDIVLKDKIISIEEAQKKILSRSENNSKKNLSNKKSSHQQLEFNLEQEVK